MDGENTPAPVKRGRPAKNAAVYTEDGTLVLTAEERAYINDLNREIDRLMESIKQNIQDAVLRLFDLGDILYKMIDRVPTLKLKICSKLTGINYDRVSQAFRTYDKFKNNLGQLADMTMSDLMPLIRVKRLPDAKEGGTETHQIQYASLPGGGEEAARESFGIAPLSGALLLRHRIRANPQDGKYYLLEEGCGAAIPIASLSVDMPQNAEQQAAFREMQDEIQCAMERYYAVIEQDGRI